MHNPAYAKMWNHPLNGDTVSQGHQPHTKARNLDSGTIFDMLGFPDLVNTKAASWLRSPDFLKSKRFIKSVVIITWLNQCNTWNRCLTSLTRMITMINLNHLPLRFNFIDGQSSHAKAQSWRHVTCNHPRNCLTVPPSCLIWFLIQGQIAACPSANNCQLTLPTNQSQVVNHVLVVITNNHWQNQSLSFPSDRHTFGQGVWTPRLHSLTKHLRSTTDESTRCA